jgi:hypothetical protein
MIQGNFNIRIEVADNGYIVEVPDVEKLAEHEKECKKKDSPPTWYGDFTEKRVAKTTGEVLSIVKAALANLPEAEYDDAFEEASKKETE